MSKRVGKDNIFLRLLGLLLGISLVLRPRELPRSSPTRTCAIKTSSPTKTCATRTSSPKNNTFLPKSDINANCVKFCDQTFKTA